MGDRTVSGKALIDTLFEFSNLISHAEDMSAVFPTLVDLTRKIIIFDNIVIYLEENDDLRPIFAKSIGRGRSKEADLAWGEAFIERVFSDDKLSIHQDVVKGPKEDRLKTPYYIGRGIYRLSKKNTLAFQAQFDPVWKKFERFVRIILKKRKKRS